MRGGLSAAFLEGAGTSGTEGLDDTELESRLRDVVQTARAAWPGIDLDEVEFVAHAGNLAGRGDALATWFENVRPADLFLAFACVKGRAAAIEAFEREFSDDIRRALMRFGRSEEHRDELLQALRHKLFVGTESSPPKLASYAGIGFLQNWVRVTATRTFLDLRRRRDATPEVQLDMALLAQSDFELGVLKQRHRADFKAAFADATAALEPAERNLLRRRLEGLNVDQLGALEGVHRSTAARRLERARNRLLQHTRTKLGERLGLEQSELDSVMRQVQTLDVSLERLLQTKDPA